MVEIGKKYGMLTCEGKDYSKDNRYYLFKCDCGKTCSAIGSNVQRGATRSCGCYRNHMLTNGLLHRKHGGKGSRLYTIWKDMRSRCDNPNGNRAHIYIEKGIKYCDEWNDFSNFRSWALDNGYDSKFTLDRIDCNKGYEPSNCRWASYTTQANNKNTNVIWEVFGESHTIAEWSEIMNVPYKRLWNRVNKLGWTPERALTR